MHERAIQLSGVTLTFALLAPACAHETQGDLSVFSEEVLTGGNGSGVGGHISQSGSSGSSSGQSSIMAGTSSTSTGGTFGGPGSSMGGVPGFSGTLGMGGVSGTPTAGTGGSAGTAGKAASGGGGGLPPAGGDECRTGKLTAAAAAASSSEDAGGLGAALAIDGVDSTRWSSEHSAPQWLALDLGEQHHVSRVVVRWEAAFASEYRVEIAENANGPWTELFEDRAGNGGTDDVDDFEAHSGRYVRLYGVERSTVYGFSVFEMELYGDPDPACAG